MGEIKDMYYFFARPVIPFLCLSVFLSSCGEHRGENIQSFTGDYRYNEGIGEFFDCKSGEKYYVINTSENEKLIEEYLAYRFTKSDDIYIRIKGYLKEVPQIEGVDPVLEFAPVELIESNADRGCSVGERQGN